MPRETCAMIRLLGNPKTLCDGITRRDLLHLGGLSLLGLNLAHFSRLQAAQQKRPAPSAIPRNIALPFSVYAHVNFRLLGGPYAGFLGQQYDPLWTAFDASGTHEVPVLAEGSGKLDPFAGIKPQDRFEL